MNDVVYLFPFATLFSSTLQTNIFGLIDNNPVWFNVLISNCSLRADKFLLLFKKSKAVSNIAKCSGRRFFLFFLSNLF